MALPYKLFSGVSCSDIATIVPLYWKVANGNPLIAQIVTDGFGGYYSVTTGAINSSSFSGNDQLVTVSIGTNSCPGVVSRPFSYNPEQSIIDGTYNIGTMCVGVDQLIYYNSPGGLTWWGGPNENQGYCIGTVVPERNQSTPLGDIGNVKFWRTSPFTDKSFLKLVEEATGLIFANTMDAIFYLDDNNYWTSYPAERFYFVVSNRWSRPKGYDHIDFGYVTPNSTPAYRLYLKPGPQNIGVNNYTLIATDNYGSPPKITNSEVPHQYQYGKHAWLTDVWVYKKGGTIVYSFPHGGTTTYGTEVYQNIVLPYI